QRHKLIRTRLQHVEIVREILAADLIHSVSYPSHQGISFVAGEVESARIPHVAQEGLEGLARLFVHHVLSTEWPRKRNIPATRCSPGRPPPTPSCPTNWAHFPIPGTAPRRCSDLTAGPGNRVLHAARRQRDWCLPRRRSRLSRPFPGGGWARCRCARARFR